jgi:hypothetical protein
MIGQNDEFDLLLGSALAMGAIGDKAKRVVTYPCDVVWAVVIPEGADANATAGVVKFDKRPTPESDVGRTDGTLGVCLKKANTNQVGKPIVDYVGGSQTLLPGEQVVVEVTTANGAALNFTASLICRPSAESWRKLEKDGKAFIMA